MARQVVSVRCSDSQSVQIGDIGIVYGRKREQGLFSGGGAIFICFSVGRMIYYINYIEFSA